MIKPGARIAAYEAKEISEGKHHGHEAAPLSSAAPADHSTTAPAEHAEASAASHGASAAGDHGDAHAADQHTDESKSFKMGFTIPGIPELGTMIGFLSLFLFFFFNQLQRASLVPMKDPFLEESLHHSTGVYDEDGDGHHGH